MNEGLNPNIMEEDTGYSHAWWAETSRMINRGWLHFCRKRGLDPKAGGLGDQIHQDATVGQARIAARLQEGSNNL